jgi:hypothetical protein
VAPLLEPHEDAPRLHFHLTARLDELALGLLRGGLVEPAKVVCQPAVAPVGQHCQGHVQVNIQPHLTGQAVEVKEVDAGAQASSTPLRPA